jgi:hypothetical protein
MMGKPQIFIIVVIIIGCIALFGNEWVKEITITQKETVSVVTDKQEKVSFDNIDTDISKEMIKDYLNKINKEKLYSKYKKSLTKLQIDKLIKNYEEGRK